MILAGDIGGTKTVLALFEESQGVLRAAREETFPSREHARFGDLVSAFLAKQRPALRAACFGVAGAVIGGRVRTTNLPWTLEENALAESLGARRVKLLNDLEATAYGMLFLAPEASVVLQPGAERGRRGHRAVIAAGTGLGEAMLYDDGAHFHPVASEGGHADFAPRTEQEIELLRFLRAKLGGHVSTERVLSGPGLRNVYDFLRRSEGVPEPGWLAERMREEDPSAVITQAALAEQDPVCSAALELFVSLYGAEAGNHALRCLALGGVWVGGGIAPKILPALRGGGFLAAFRDKGRFAKLLEGLEVRVALEPRTALLGAAHYALRI